MFYLNLKARHRPYGVAFIGSNKSLTKEQLKTIKFILISQCKKGRAHNLLEHDDSKSAKQCHDIAVKLHINTVLHSNTIDKTFCKAKLNLMLYNRKEIINRTIVLITTLSLDEDIPEYARKMNKPVFIIDTNGSLSSHF